MAVRVTAPAERHRLVPLGRRILVRQEDGAATVALAEEDTLLATALVPVES